MAVQHHMASGIVFGALSRYGGGFPDNAHFIIIKSIFISRFFDLFTEKNSTATVLIRLRSYSEGR